MDRQAMGAPRTEKSGRRRDGRVYRQCVPHESLVHPGRCVAGALRSCDGLMANWRDRLTSSRVLESGLD